MKLLCFGDSNTYGYDPRSFFGERYDRNTRWTGLLEQETAWEIVNAGRNGREIPHTPRQRQQAVEEIGCYDGFDLLAVMLGGNDLLQNPDFGVKEVTTRMEAFLRFLMAAGYPFLLLIAPSPMQQGTWVTEERLVRESAALGAEYEALAGRLGIPFADSGRWGIEVLFDGVHYSEKGHRAFAEGMKAVLKTLWQNH